MNVSPEAKQAAEWYWRQHQEWLAGDLTKETTVEGACQQAIDAALRAVGSTEPEATAKLREANKLLADINNLLITKNDKLKEELEEWKGLAQLAQDEARRIRQEQLAHQQPSARHLEFAAAELLHTYEEHGVCECDEEPCVIESAVKKLSAAIDDSMIGETPICQWCGKVEAQCFCGIKQIHQQPSIPSPDHAVKKPKWDRITNPPPSPRGP